MILGKDEIIFLSICVIFFIVGEVVLSSDVDVVWSVRVFFWVNLIVILIEFRIEGNLELLVVGRG